MRETLRRRAEEALEREPRPQPDVRTLDPEVLLHEVLVHEVELDLQDEELRKTMSALAQAQEDLRQAHKLEIVGAMASGVAHDLGNVLQAVMGCAQVAADPSTEAEVALDHMRRAFAVARRGSRLVRKLMAFSRKRPSDRRPIAIDAAVAESVEVLRRLLTKHIELEVEVRGDAFVAADPTEIEQILLNLGANARDAMPDGGALRIRVDRVALDAEEAERRHLARPGAYVRLVVQDTGLGMDPETRARIFDRFFTTKGREGGTGLGLAAVLSLTASLDGSVEVESELGRGTTFTFHFPACEGPGVDSLAPPDAMPVFAGTALLVEDEPEVRMSVARHLRDLGFDVLEAEDVGDALRACTEHRGNVALLVSDVMMRELAGPRLAVLLRRFYPRLRALFMSAYPRATLLETGMIDPPSALLQKPFGKEELAARLVVLLEKTGEADETFEREREPSSDGSENETILIVEDEEASRLALRDVLRDEGFVVLDAPSPLVALALAREPTRRVDLLLTDLRLPETSGIALAEEMRRLQPELEVVFMSGLADPPEETRGAYVPKPVELDFLVDVVRERLAKRHRRSV